MANRISCKNHNIFWWILRRKTAPESCGFDFRYANVGIVSKIKNKSYKINYIRDTDRRICFYGWCHTFSCTISKGLWLPEIIKMREIIFMELIWYKINVREHLYFQPKIRLFTVKGWSVYMTKFFFFLSWLILNF